MEEKIDQILLANFTEGDWQNARKQLLLLFSVSGRSEQLCGTCTDFKIEDGMFVCKKCGKKHKNLSA